MNTDIPPPTPPTPETTAPKATKNVLRIREIVALHEWVTVHTADCRTQPDTKLAAIAQAELEFTVTAANIAGMRAEIGIEKLKKEAPPSMDEQVQQLRGLIELERVTRLLLEGRVSALEAGTDGVPDVIPDPAPPVTTGQPPLQWADAE